MPCVLVLESDSCMCGEALLQLRASSSFDCPRDPSPIHRIIRVQLHALSKESVCYTYEIAYEEPNLGLHTVRQRKGLHGVRLDRT